jgi:hypothetical protein
VVVVGIISKFFAWLLTLNYKGQAIADLELIHKVLYPLLEFWRRADSLSNLIELIDR